MKSRRPLSKAALHQRAMLLKFIGPTARLTRLMLGEDAGTRTGTGTTITRVTGTRTTTGTTTGAKMGDKVLWRT